jgi:hypothetical protein
MQDDLGTIAENALNEMEQADANNGGTPPAAPEGDDNAPQGGESEDENQDNDNTPDGGEDENAQNGEASEENNEGEDDSQEESENEDELGAGDGKKGKQASELTDDELLAELEKRGKKPETPEKKDDKQEEAKPLPRPAEVPEDVWGGMNEFQRTVYDKLPYIEIRNEEGKSLRIKHNSQIPADFKWISEEAKNQFYAVDLPAQSVLAERIAGQLQGQTQQQQQEAQARAEADAVVKGIDALINQGIVPKITAQPGTAEFNNDPGVQRANEILTLRRQYLSRGEFITIETAGRIFKAEHPELYQPKPTKSPADAERKKASRNISGGGGRGTASDAKKGGSDKAKVWPIGTTAEDIADAYADQLD